MAYQLFLLADLRKALSSGRLYFFSKVESTPTYHGGSLHCPCYWKPFLLKVWSDCPWFQAHWIHFFFFNIYLFIAVLFKYSLGLLSCLIPVFSDAYGNSSFSPLEQWWRILWWKGIPCFSLETAPHEQNYYCCQALVLMLGSLFLFPCRMH